ncbi:DUF748 domain-containing protein [Fulvivirga sp.]|uniref:DUF748 domain-containing protein n=1 Tax=Fulvivirga sp. TaxID=1931237 RepID=UPI0032EE40A3
MKLLTKIVLCIILIIIVGSALLAWKAESIIKHNTEDYISALTNGEYKLKFDELNIGYFPLRLKVTNANFNSSDSTYIKIDSTNVLITFSADQIDLNSIDFISFLIGSEGRLRLQFEAPQLVIYHSSDSNIKVTELNKPDSKKRSILFKSLTINKGYIKYLTDTLKFETEVDYVGEKISSENLKNDIKLASDFTLNNIKYETANGLDKVEVRKLVYGKKGELALSDIVLLNVPNKYELGHILGHEATWHEIKIDSIKAANPNTFFHNDTIKISNLGISGFKALMFRDKRLKFPNIPDRPMIKAIISKIKVPMVIDRFALDNGQITYQEHISDFEEAGTINFEKLTIAGSNISTLHSSGETKFEASALLMGKGLLEIEGTVPHAKNKSHYTLSGTIHSHDLTIYNPILNYVGGVHITSGLVKKSFFNFTYDSVSSSGALNMIYENLNVKFTNSEGDVSKNKLDDKLKNFIANTFVIKKNNELKGNTRVGKIEFERNPKKSYLNYWWKSLLSGIKSSIGMKQK